MDPELAKAAKRLDRAIGNVEKILKATPKNKESRAYAANYRVFILIL